MGSSESQSNIYHSLGPFFEASIMCISDVPVSINDKDGHVGNETDSTPTEYRVLRSKISPSKLIEASQTIRDEVYKAHYAKYECGRKNYIALKFRSNLPADIELNSL